MLVLNDFGMEYDYPDHRRRRRLLLNLVDDFKRRNTPIDAVGFQSHLATRDSANISTIAASPISSRRSRTAASRS